MIRALLLFLLLCSAAEFLGQDERAEFFHHVGSLPDSSVQIVYERTAKSHSRYIIFESENGKDSIPLSPDANPFHSNSCSIEEIQIDGKGRAEIHIIWSYDKPFGLGDYIGGARSWGMQIHFEHHEIWNLDTKERFFSAISDYSLEEYTIYHGAQERRTETKSSWKYSFSIEEDSSIIIRGLRHSGTKAPDHSEGKYVFENGVYRKLE